MKLVQIVPPTLVEYSLPKSTLILGSGEDVDIKIEGDDIFSKHAAIWENRGFYAISDWGKQGNLWVNGKETVSGQALYANDEIKLGKVVLKFVPDHFSAASSSTRALLEPLISPTEILNRISPETRTQLRRITLCSPEKTQLWQKKYFRRMKIFKKLGKRTFSPKTTISPIEKCNQFWREYSQTAFQSPSAYHLIENGVFRHNFSADISNVNFATAWVSQLITVLFEHQQYLENEWLEYTLLQLIDDAVADSVIARRVFDKIGRMVDEHSTVFVATRHEILQESQEEIDLEILQNKKTLGVDEIKKRWMKRCPYTRPLQHQHKKYTVYRREVFLEFLMKESIRLPRQIGIYIWGKYYEYEAQKLTQFKIDKNILTNLSFKNGVMQKKNVPLWKAKIGFSFSGQQYLIDVAHRDERGRLLAFVPGKPDDSGEALVLIESDDGTIVDQQGRQITIDKDGSLTIESKLGITRKKQLRPTPTSIIKTIISAIIHESRILKREETTQTVFVDLDDIPVVINWDTQSTRSPLLNIASTERHKTIQVISLFKTPRAMQCAVHPHFFSPLSGALFFRYLNFEVMSGYRKLMRRNVVAQNHANVTLHRLTTVPTASKIDTVTTELSAEATGIHQSVLNGAIENLAKHGISASNTDLMLIFLTMTQQQYKTGAAVRRNMATLQQNENSTLINAIETMWQDAREKPSAIIWMQNTLCSSLDGGVYPLLFKNITADFSVMYDEFSQKTESRLRQENLEVSSRRKRDFLEKLRQSLAYLEMLKQIVRQKQNPNSAALSVLSAFSDDEKAMTRLPIKIGGTTTMKQSHELFSIIGDIVPLQYTSRMMHAREDNMLRPLIWSVVAQSGGDYTLVLRDSRQPILDLANAGYQKEAQQMTQDTLDAFVSGFNRFVEILIQI